MQNSKSPEETIDLGVARISKKYSEIDGKLCFGVVTAKKEKYIISLRNQKDCMKIFFEILSAKKLLANHNLWRETLKEGASFNPSENIFE